MQKVFTAVTMVLFSGLLTSFSNANVDGDKNTSSLICVQDLFSVRIDQHKDQSYAITYRHGRPSLDPSFEYQSNYVTQGANVKYSPKTRTLNALLQIPGYMGRTDEVSATLTFSEEMNTGYLSIAGSSYGSGFYKYPVVCFQARN